ncbi:MFS transporter [Lactobacillus sp. ESL0731]|uniref:MFS transporter n=1 Tax=unclassified Lactobacillus TaxID=2620435 RepID=UPI0023F83135|nr:MULTISPECIES: MFS transporter [unclassified Lactobacillus]WEV51170.1 MFS transporter [Lactobacillus sp. ESL0700]WEV62300.1 MFS transporter [Lactobacillus sp. ESL0731]
MNTKFKKIGGIIALALMMFMTTLDTTIANIALPAINKAFSSSLTDSNWISTVYLLVLSVFMIPGSKLADQFGRKKLAAIGLIIFGIGSLVSGLAQSLRILIISRCFQGFGGAILAPIVVPLAVSLFGTREKAQGSIGLLGGISAAAAASGPPVGGLLIHLWSWRTIFFINLPLAIIAFLLLLSCFTESYDSSISKKIDWLGLIFFSWSLFALTLVLLKASTWGWSSKTVIWLLISSVIAFVFFGLDEHYNTEPLIDLSLFKDMTFTSSALVYLACGFTIVCSSVVFNLYLENILNYSTLNAGYIIMFSSLTVMVVVPLGNKLGKEFNYRWPVTAGAVLMFASLVLLTQLNYQMTRFQMIFTMIVLGAGFGLAGLSQISAVLHISAQKVGIGSGIVNAIRQLGSCLGIALLIGVLNNNMTSSVKSVRQSALQEVQTSYLAPDIKQAVKKEIKETASSDGKITNYTIDYKKLKHAIVSEKTVPRFPKKTQINKIIQGNQKMSKVEINLGRLTKNNPMLSGTLNKLASKQNLETHYLVMIKQKQILQSILSKIFSMKHRETTKAFNKTFILGAFCLIVFIPVGLWCDVKRQ